MLSQVGVELWDLKITSALFPVVFGESQQGKALLLCLKTGSRSHRSPGKGEGREKKTAFAI